MNKRIIDYDSSSLIWFDFNQIDVEELDNTEISNFNITNMPVEINGTDMLNNPNYVPKEFELHQYYVCFFADNNSNTGYSCMCINKNRTIYKSKIGYDECGNPTKKVY